MTATVVITITIRIMTTVKILYTHIYTPQNSSPSPHGTTKKTQQTCRNLWTAQKPSREPPAFIHNNNRNTCNNNTSATRNNRTNSSNNNSSGSSTIIIKTNPLSVWPGRTGPVAPSRRRTCSRGRRTFASSRRSGTRNKRQKDLRLWTLNPKP